MATNTNTKPPPSLPANGIITAPNKGMVGGNRKKQKRRAKQAAKQPTQPSHSPGAAGQPGDLEYDEDPLGYGEEEYDDSEADAEQYREQYGPPHPHANGVHSPPPPATSKKRSDKTVVARHGSAYNPEMLPPLPHLPPPPGKYYPGSKGGHGHYQGNIWNTSTAQERQNIKDFWLGLSEEERKELLKIEKEAVLRKMKQQQKHSCSCNVCGRKRTAIEEELEVLYEGYYEELEQYAHHDHPPLPPTDGIMPRPLQHRHPHPLATAPPPMPQQHRTSQVHEHLDDDELSEEEEEYSDDEDYSDEEPGPEPEPPRAHPGVPDFFNFGSHLTVKDNLLTVADDLLKNDGRKFIEMMEQLAERRMQRENRSQYEADHHSGYAPNESAYPHEEPLAPGEELDDEESFESGDEYDDEMEEEDEMGGLTEEQRMQEGRRMFQIFAARMFEQRVLTAYREKVAAERQMKLLQEIDDEAKNAAEREAKKQRDAQKKKDKKKQQQAVKAEEKAKRDAEKAEEEARLKQAEELKLEEQRRKKDEQRKKREEEKRKLDEEKTRKETEKLRRQQEEQQRREDAERKVREQKAAEKARKEETRKRERYEREAREKEARERKAQDDREVKEREARANAEKAAKEREKTAQQAAQPPLHPPQITKRPSQAGMVAVPGVFPKPTASGISSPYPTIATPALPKAPISIKARQPSRQSSHPSSPKQAQSQMSSAPSKSSSPGSIGPPQSSVQPKTIMQKSGNQQAGQQPQHSLPSTSPPHAPPIQPPPGVGHPHQQHPNSFSPMPHMGFQNFQGHPSMHNMGPRRDGPFPMMPGQGLGPMGMPQTPRMPFPSMNGMPPPQHPPGMLSPMPPNGRAMGLPFDGPGQNQPPPGFSQQQFQQQNHHASSIGPLSNLPGGDSQRQKGLPSHARQRSGGEKDRFDFAGNQPIARPAPIQRPGSVKPQDGRGSSGADVDDLSKHLGSSALLDDSDEPMPSNLADKRRSSNVPPGARPFPPGSSLGGFGPPGNVGGFGTPSSSWNTPSLPFSQAPGPGWGSLPAPGSMHSSWTHNNAAFGANAGNAGPFGTLGGPPMHRPVGAVNRPLTIRLAICQACKQLSQTSREGDTFHPIDAILRQIEANRPPLDAPPSLPEIEAICETEGDAQNGGGELSVRKAAGRFAVKWAPDGGAAADYAHGGGGRGGLGEIGSPMPAKTAPASGFGAPGMGRAGGGQQQQLPNLGAVGSGNV